MDTKKALISSAVVGLLALGATATAQAAEAPSEKCYGVAKAGKNDCASKTHGCQGLATTSGDGKEWIKLPAGTCERLNGGSLTSKS